MIKGLSNLNFIFLKFFIDPAKLIPVQRFLTPAGRGGVTKRGAPGGRGGGRGAPRGGKLQNIIYFPFKKTSFNSTIVKGVRGGFGGGRGGGGRGGGFNGGGARGSFGKFELRLLIKSIIANLSDGLLVCFK